MSSLCVYELGQSRNAIFTIVEHSPSLFRDIRKKFGVSEDFLFNSLAPLHNIQAIHNFFTGSGKSSSFFFFSDNRFFVFKTLKDSEKKLLFEQSILESYYEYIMKNPDSLLSRYYGIFTIQMPGMEELTCFITDNLYGKEYQKIKRIYDLKGSTQNRRVKLSKEEEIGDVDTAHKVLKDLNFIDFQDRMRLSKTKKITLMSIIERDAQFLALNNLMDFSLLLIKLENQTPKRLLHNSNISPHTTTDIQPAMILVRAQNGDVRLELRNSINIRSQLASLPSDKNPNTIKSDRDTKTTNDFKTARGGGDTNEQMTVVNLDNLENDLRDRLLIKE